MFKLASLILGIAGATALSVANAVPILLTFEGISDSTPILNFYNGGTDGQGHSGPNYGVSFSNTAYAYIDSDAGGVADIANEPSSSTLLGPAGTTVIMNVAAGFENELSLFYTSFVRGLVTVYTGLNATGSALANANLTINYNLGGCTGDPNGTPCHWDPITLSFGGSAKSALFQFDAIQSTAIDNIAFSPVAAAVPEPGSLALLGLGLFGLAPRLKRRPAMA